MTNFLRPEEKNNLRKRALFADEVSLRRTKMKPLYRAHQYIYEHLIEDSRAQVSLYKMSHRSSTWKFWVLTTFSMYVGSILYYLNYKINVVEPHWIADYGQDVPIYRMFKLRYKWKVWSIKYGTSFQRFKLFYFVEEQKIDPLNSNTLVPKTYEVY